MIRTGEVVVVPIRFSLIRCGISEPVTNIVRSFVAFLFCELCSTGLSASAEPENRTTAIRLAVCLENNVLMGDHTTAKNTVQIAAGADFPFVILSAAKDL
jgi:hypothetical protein